jgi:hypothetical protein
VKSKRISLVLVCLSALLVPLRASAIDSCKVKVNSQDGTILVSAKNIAGVVRWGYGAAEVVKSFSNAGTCVAGGVATKCQLGATGTAQAVIPPSLCTLHLADSSSTCSVFIKGCAPRTPQLVVKDATGAIFGVASMGDGGYVAVMVGTSAGVRNLRLNTETEGLPGALQGFGTLGAIYFSTGDCSGPVFVGVMGDSVLGGAPTLVGATNVANPTTPFALYVPAGSGAMGSYGSYDSGNGCVVSSGSTTLAPAALVATYIPPLHVEMQ